MPTGSTSFCLDYRLNGRCETLHFGKYGLSGLSLARAREKCIEARRMISAGLIHPRNTKINHLQQRILVRGCRQRGERVSGDFAEVAGALDGVADGTLASQQT